MSNWPLNIDLASDATLAVKLFDQTLLVERLNPGTLRYQYGEDATQARLVGISETVDKLRFVPTLGPLPLLIFPETHLLCPAKTTVQCVLRLPLHVQVGVGDEAGVKLIDEIAPPTVSKAVYGPVDSGTICTSIHAANEASIEEIERASGLATARESSLTLDAGEHVPGDSDRPLKAFAQVRAHNATDAPLTISKIMVPAGVVSLYQSGADNLTNEVNMRLLSDHEAELEFLKCPEPKAEPLADLGGKRTDTEPKRKVMFAHSYRNKTGLEFGF